MAEEPTTGTFIVGYDGTASAKRAVEFATERARGTSAAVHLVHVLEWSPYSFLTPEELNERHKRRKEEMSRANAIIEPVASELRANGVNATHEVRYGHAGEILCEIAEDRKALQIVIGRTGTTSITARLMGSLALTLVQASPVPVTVVP
jgi:nucleotide-binding universal stress UspA family protein